MLQATFEPVSSRADWVEQCEVRNESDQLVDLTTATIVLAVRDRSSQAQVLLAQTPTTITIQGLGIFGWTFSVSQMHGLQVSKVYDVGCTIKLGGITQQFFIGSVSVLDGIVP